MPFFSRSEPSPEPVYQPEPVAAEPPARKHSLFHRNRDVSPASSRRTGSIASSAGSAGPGHTKGYTNNTSGSNSGGGLFRHSTDSSASRGRRSLFHRDNGANALDPSILQAREHVMQAEAAEVDADRALGEARMRVRAAKDHVWRLEEEAKEEARRAKIKQEQAREVSKRGQGLGRHGL
ncbi:uncharacterized protein TrAFT101_010578 [Trichoderma asperellum]|uniref:Uncharacterized protein n=1 Tax=Trichoderma asperellum (strain ATCC 204424 / CBS 433.97 / NBRC 101777) TaxID=1042311 RepID=A0A2T3YT27_TRIA4|nr:hypothetical protein M441DRAFT_51767 [Trichoderma asperellum CBS 433.97]PTB35730.1 hypothetical protein M441DRAFT_51767 [Trichoderma asperellum CBS 433.97]UKZ95763.1 hypothetical protein TrAFT101_010578 [Trichoderma asperellum]